MPVVRNVCLQTRGSGPAALPGSRPCGAHLCGSLVSVRPRSSASGEKEGDFPSALALVPDPRRIAEVDHAARDLTRRDGRGSPGRARGGLRSRVFAEVVEDALELLIAKLPIGVRELVEMLRRRLVRQCSQES